MAPYRPTGGQNSSSALADEHDEFTPIDDAHRPAAPPRRPVNPPAADRRQPAARRTFAQRREEERLAEEKHAAEAAAAEAAARRARPSKSSNPRLPAPSSSVRGRAMFAAVALGAIAAATAGQSLLPKAAHHDTYLADPANTAAVIGTGGDNQQSLEVAPLAQTVDPSAEAAQIAESQRITGQQVSAASTGQTTGATFAKPANGSVVSTFGGHYGTMHYGIEIQNVKDTPIVATADGVIVSAGPTSGFGLWVKEQLSDGTTLVYARMDTYSVQVGDHVTAGQQIARMGDRGFSNGYTLHFEVWDPSGKKIDPMRWLNTRGITV